MLSVCRGPVQCRLAQLESVFTQPRWPDWEALFSHPGAFQRKSPAEAPCLRYTTLKTIHNCRIPPAVLCASATVMIIIHKVSMEH